MAEDRTIKTSEFQRKIFLKSFYSKHIPMLLPNYKHRFYKFKLFNNKWVSKRISNPNHLQRFLLKYVPKDVYQSVSLFTKPKEITIKNFKGKKAGYPYANNVIGTHLVIDLDGHTTTKGSEKPIEELYSELRKLYGLLSVKFSDFLFVRTGRGFHLHILDFDNVLDKSFENPMQRISYIEQKKYIFIKKLKEVYFKKYGIELIVCEDTSIDTWRIVRVPLSVHNNGTVCFATKNLLDQNLLNPARLFN